MKTQTLSLVALSSLALACSQPVDVASSESEMTSSALLNVHVRYYGDENVSLFRPGTHEPFATVGAYGVTATTIDVPAGTYEVRGQDVVDGEYELLATFTVGWGDSGVTFHCGPSAATPGEELCSKDRADIEAAPEPPPPPPAARDISIRLRFDASWGAGTLTAHRPDGSKFAIGVNEVSPPHGVRTGDSLWLDVWSGGDKRGETSFVVPLSASDDAILACRLDMDTTLDGGLHPLICGM